MSNSTMMSAAIPVGSRKVVQSLKEIVDCPEHEIYSMLKECNMDIDDTINRLLSQDTFQEVKTKRERKKEVKEALESRPQGIKSDVYASHSGQDGEIWGWDSELGKPQLLSSTSRTTTKQTNELPQSYISHSEPISATNQEQFIGTGDWPVCENLHLSAQTSTGTQPAWSGVPGHASMADIIRMGKSNDKWSNAPTMSETISEPDSTVGQHSNHGTWPVPEQSRATSIASDTEVYSYPTSSHSSRANLPHKGHTNEVAQASDDVPAYSGQVVMESARVASHQEPETLNDMNSYRSTGYSIERQEGVIGDSKSHVPCFSAPLTADLNIALSSTTASFQQLGLGKKDSQERPVDNNSVTIPSHLQALAGDCSHLTFGTLKFGNGWEVTHSSSFIPIKNDLEEFTSAAKTRSSHSHLEDRIGDYHSDEQLRSMYDSHRVHMDHQAYDSTIKSRSELMNPTKPKSTQLRMDSQAYDSTITSRSELRNSTMPESTQLQQDVFPSSLHGYDIENRQQLSSTLPYTMPESTQLQEDVFPSSLHGYDIENRQQLRSTLPFAPQSNRHTIDTLTFSNGMPNSRAGITTGPSTQQSLNSYCQASHPTGQASNMDNYPIQPRTNAYSQSANQQAYSAFQLEALESAGLFKSQYKNSSSVNSLPQSAVNASGYGQYRSFSPTGNFLQNPSANPTYNDILSSLYKGGNQYRMPQQNESSTMADYVPSSITHPSVPNSLYYELQRHNQKQIQNQEQPVYRQGQPQAMQQRYGGPEYQYPSSDHLQRRFTQDDEQQKYFTTNGIQGPSSDQSQKYWQHRY